MESVDGCDHLTWSLEAAWLLSDGKEAAATRQHFPLLLPQLECWDPQKVTKFLCFGRVGICPCTTVHPHTQQAPCTPHVSALPTWCFNNPENCSTNIKYQINPQNWCRFPHRCSSCLAKLLQWSVLSIKGTSSKLMKQKNAFVRHTY